MALGDDSQPSVSANTRVAAGAVIVLAGLLLIVFGGCFLMGALMVVAPTGMPGPDPSTATDSTRILLGFLYGFAIACFLGAITLLGVGITSLLKILHHRERP